MIHAFVLLFMLCGPGEGMCEDGIIWHRTCAAAEDYLRAGLREDQSIYVTDCMTQAQFKARESD